MKDKSSIAGGCWMCSPPNPFEIKASRNWRVVLNHNQDRLGKVMLCLDRHEEDMTQLSRTEVDALWEQLRGVKKALDSLFQPDHYNYMFLMNLDPHLHLHVVPRYKSPREFAGSQFTDADEVAVRKLPEQDLRDLTDLISTALKAESEEK